jgi:hypothetical protein
MEHPGLKEHVDEILKRIERESPNIVSLICKKDYTRPLGYESPSISMLSAFASADLILSRMVMPEQDPATYSAYLSHGLLIKYQMPTYFVSEDLCEALLKTEAPEDLLFSEIKWPMPIMRFMLPIEFSKRYFGSEVPYITAALVEVGARIESPIIIRGQRVPPLDIQNEHPFFCATMLKWENDLPMQYDSRCPINRQVGDLLNTDLSHFQCAAPEGVESDPNEDVKTVNRLSNLAINILLAMTAEPELITPERMLRPTKWNGKHVVRRALWKPNFIGERFKVIYESVAPVGSHKSPHSHWRKGHWRNQRHGEKNTLVKRIWIKPVFVGLTHEKKEEG